MKRSHIRVEVVLVAAWCIAALSSGCSIFNWQVGDPLGPSHAQFQDERTNVHNVVAALGPPAKLGALPEGLVMLYEYADITEQQLGLNLSFANLQVLKLAIGQGKVAREALLLVFDEHGVLQAHRFDAWKEGLGRGFGLQLFFAAVPTVEVGYLLEPPEPHGWGAGLLDPPPVTLNTDHSVRHGKHGLQMRGTPTGAGQHTLEMGEDK